MMKNVSLLLWVFIPLILIAQDPVLNENFLQTDGEVYAVEYDQANDLVYIGGQFTYVGRPEPYSFAIDQTSGAIDFSFANPNGQIIVSIPDGNGGWYIGGVFTTVGGELRNNLAQLDATGQVTSWNPNADDQVNSLAISGSTIYAGGFFTNIGGQTRIRIAALDANTGNATSWNPSASSQVATIAVSGSTVYVGGSFTSIGGQSRNRIAALDAATGLATSWNPSASGPFDTNVFDIVVSGQIVYVGGRFNSIGGQTRFNIAAINAITGAATSWNPSADAAVFSLAVSGSTVYTGGNFVSIGGQGRNFIAALDATSGLATSWNPSASNQVRTIAVSGSTVYVGGAFTSIGGQSRNHIAGLDISTGSATSWNPSTNFTVDCLAISSTTVYACGDFTFVGGQFRKNIAALDASTGVATNWNPSANFAVRSFAVSSSTVYVGGEFTSIGGQNRNRIAALNTTTGAAKSWNPSANATVSSLAIYDSTVFAGGSFSNIGFTFRSRLAAIDTTTGFATSWIATANGEVLSLAVSGSNLYAGGFFTGIGGQSRNHIAALDLATGAPTSWNPSASSSSGVLSLAVSGSYVYAGGFFTSIGGQSRNRIAAVDITTGLATSWNPNANGPISTIAVSGSTVYAGGLFTFIGGQSRNNIAALDTITGAPTNWNPSGDGSVYSLGVSGSNIYAGGSFESIDGKSIIGFAAFDFNTTCTIDASCTPYTLTLSPSGNATLQPDDVNNGSTASCGTPILSLSQINFDATHIGENTVILTVEDENGNTDTCQAVVTVLPNPESCRYFLSNHNAQGGSDVYEMFIDEDTYTASLSHLVSVPQRVNLSFNNSSNLLFLGRENNNSATFQTLNPDSEVLGLPISVNVNLSGFTGAAFGPDGMLYIASQTSGAIYRFNPSNFTGSLFSSALVNGGDIDFDTDGKMVLVSRSPARAYIVNEGAPNTILGPVPNTVSGLARRGDGTFLLSAAGNNKLILGSTEDGDLGVRFDLLLNGAPFTPGNGDLASGCPLPTGEMVGMTAPNLSENAVNAHARLSSQPNPTSDINTVSFTAKEEARYTLEVYDMQGRSVQTIFDQITEQGLPYRVIFDGTFLPNGVYIYRLTTGSAVEVAKFMIAR